MTLTLARLRNHLRRRLLIGLLVFAPFGLTIFILWKLVTWGKELLTRPIDGLLQQLLRSNPDLLRRLLVTDATGGVRLWFDYAALFTSILLTLIGLYLIGVLSATFFGRRHIARGEKLLLRIPGAQFVYNTVKQLLEILSRPKSQAFQKVVLIEFPRKGVWCIAFFTGVTTDPETGEFRVNVFLPSTPNPTTGFLLVMKPSEVLLTDLTVSEASRFVFSFGVVELGEMKTRPFPIEEYRGEQMGDRARGQEDKAGGAPVEAGGAPVETSR
ncbi:MAG TPA: DUF502 domain-containing protein [Sumerlaeia bacterium]|nr:DUF502 domain-containing protein [Sumerlaeia bacterium]